MILAAYIGTIKIFEQLTLSVTSAHQSLTKEHFLLSYVNEKIWTQTLKLTAYA